MTNKKGSKSNVIGKMQRLSAGLREHLSGHTFVLAGKSVKVDDVLALLDRYVAQLNSTDMARGAWLAEVATTRVMEDSEVDSQVALLEGYLRTFYGPSSQTLVGFGLAPRKLRERTAREKADAAVKSAATRVARHTLGPRQKAAIHGVVAPPASEPSDPPSNPEQPAASTEAIERNS